MVARHPEQLARQDALRRRTSLDEHVFHSDIQPTKEQQAIVDFVMGWSESGIVRLLATAGAGKTSTLKLIAQSQRRHKPQLVIVFAAFNRELQHYAEKYFAGLSVDCRTMHSLALAYAKRIHNISTVHDERQEKFDKLSNLLGCSPQEAKHAWEKLEKVASSDNTFEDVYAASQENVGFDDSDDSEMDADQTFEQWKASSLMWKLWDLVLKGKVAWTHSYVMKLCQLHMREHNCRLTEPPLDLLLCDEFQDFDGAQLDIVKMELQHARVVAVGDPGQSIYGFRGAVRTFEVIEPLCKESFVLSKAFRFDAKIARVANRVLQQHSLVGEYETLKVEGVGEKACSVTVGPSMFDESLGLQTPYTLLCSSNKRVFHCAAELSNHSKVEIHVLGKQFSDVLKHITQILQEIKQSKATEPEDIAMYLEPIQRDAVFEKDWCMKTACEIIDGSEPLELEHEVARITKIVVNETEAAVVLGTIHQAKGREWERVVLDHGSWWPLARHGQKRLQVDDSHQSINKVYVAMTRTKSELHVPEALSDIVNETGDEDDRDESPSSPRWC